MQYLSSLVCIVFNQRNYNSAWLDIFVSRVYLFSYSFRWRSRRRKCSALGPWGQMGRARESQEPWTQLDALRSWSRTSASCRSSTPCCWRNCIGRLRRSARWTEVNYFKEKNCIKVYENGAGEPRYSDLVFYHFKLSLLIYLDDKRK